MVIVKTLQLAARACSAILLARGAGKSQKTLRLRACSAGQAQKVGVCANSRFQTVICGKGQIQET